LIGNADRFIKKKMGNSPSFYFSARHQRDAPQAEVTGALAPIQVSL
jgi:hypothetical protein